MQVMTGMAALQGRPAWVRPAGPGTGVANPGASQNKTDCAARQCYAMTARR